MPRAVLADLPILLVFLRLGQGWTQAELAEAAGIPASLLNGYEKGRKTLTRDRLEQLAGCLGVPPDRLDASLSCLAANRAASRAGLASGEASQGGRRKEVAALRAGRLIEDAVLSLLSLVEAVADAPVQRELAQRRMARLRKRKPDERLFLVEEAPTFRSWALAESAALESVARAPNHPQEAREWAALAVRIAEVAPGEGAWRRRLQGWTLCFLANAERACNDLPAAGRALARGRKLLDEGAGGDPAGLLNAAWPPWIEGSLQRAQRRFGEALQKIDEALRLDTGELRGQILLSKARIFEALGEPETSTAILLEAEPLVDPRQEPRLALVLRFNLLVDLCDLGNAAEARPRLVTVRTLAEELGEPLDLVRCTWLHGKIESGLGHSAEAVASFQQVRRDFRERGLAYDHALASLDLSLVLLELDRPAEVATIAQEMLWIFESQGVHREALAALGLFCEAARREAATVELARRIERYLRRAQLDPGLPFEG